jgi:hypothetical protein
MFYLPFPSCRQISIKNLTPPAKCCENHGVSGYAANVSEKITAE